MTIELPERHPSPPLRPCTEPDSETFEKLRRTRLLLMNLVREGVLHRSEYARLMRRTLIDHFVVDGARHGSQISGARDQWITPEKVEELKEAARKYNLPVEVVSYDADHAFFNDTRPEVYNPEAAADAWRRVLNFFDGLLRK
jgi:hypothetical protein